MSWLAGYVARQAAKTEIKMETIYQVGYHASWLSNLVPYIFMKYVYANLVPYIFNGDMYKY